MITRPRRFVRASWKIFRNRYLSFAFRLALGITFIVSGIGKLSAGSVFVDEVAEFDLLPDILNGVYGTALPWVEIIVGALLILGLVLRFASAVGILTTLSFIIANSVVLYRGLDLECGCFGDLAVLHTRDALVIDFVFLLMAFQILVHRGDFLSLGSRIFRGKHPEPAPD